MLKEEGDWWGEGGEEGKERQKREKRGKEKAEEKKKEEGGYQLANFISLNPVVVLAAPATQDSFHQRSKPQSASKFAVNSDKRVPSFQGSFPLLKKKKNQLEYNGFLKCLSIHLFLQIHKRDYSKKLRNLYGIWQMPFCHHKGEVRAWDIVCFDRTRQLELSEGITQFLKKNIRPTWKAGVSLQSLFYCFQTEQSILGR